MLSPPLGGLGRGSLKRFGSVSAGVSGTIRPPGFRAGYPLPRVRCCQPLISLPLLPRFLFHAVRDVALLVLLALLLVLLRWLPIADLDGGCPSSILTGCRSCCAAAVPSLHKMVKSLHIPLEYS